MNKVTPHATLEDLHKKLGPEFRKQSEDLQKLEQEIMKHIMNKVKIYLDDVRTPVDPSWIVVRNYEQFVDTVTYNGLENIELICTTTTLLTIITLMKKQEWIVPNG
jgi:hypothetical protein